MRTTTHFRRPGTGGQDARCGQKGRVGFLRIDLTSYMDEVSCRRCLRLLAKDLQVAEKRAR